MKYMSESLLKFTGEKLRNTLNSLTSNKFKGLFFGTLITSVIQFSAATAIMAIGFVNARLLSVRRAMPILLGANIGTTLKPWLFLYFGFKLNFVEFAIPLLGFAFPLLFTKNATRKSYGEVIIGFALTIIALEILKQLFPNVSEHPEWLTFITNFTHLGFLSTLLFVIIGFAATVVTQSSSAVLALTMILCSQGWLPFPLAAAMVIGENIGTTIMPNIAAIVANTEAKRLARFHFFSKLFGAIWAIAIFSSLINLSDFVTIKLTHASPFSSYHVIPFALAFLHTFFNLINAFILIGFLNKIDFLLEKYIPVKTTSNETNKLQFIDDRISSTSELSLLTAHSEIAEFAKKTESIFLILPELIREKESDIYEKLISKLDEYKIEAHAISNNLNNYLSKIAECNLSQTSLLELRIMLNTVDNIQNTALICNQIALTIDNKNKQNLWFTQDLRDNINQLIELCKSSFSLMVQNISGDYSLADIHKAEVIEHRINELRNKLRVDYLQNINNSEYPTKNGIVYNQLISQLEKTADYVFEISIGLSEIQKERR